MAGDFNRIELVVAPDIIICVARWEKMALDRFFSSFGFSFSVSPSLSPDSYPSRWFACVMWCARGNALKKKLVSKLLFRFRCEYVLCHYVVADETMFGSGSVYVLLFIIFIPFFFSLFFLFSRLSSLSMVSLYLLLIITTAASLVRTALWIFASAIVFVGV